MCRIEEKRRADLEALARATEASSSKKKAPTTAKGTPYKATSRWSRLLKVSTLQRTVQIWSFAIIFTIKYFLLGKKFTYGKKVRAWTLQALTEEALISCSVMMSIMSL